MGVQLGLKLAAGAGRVVLDVEGVDIFDRTLMILSVQQTFDQTLNENALGRNHFAVPVHGVGNLSSERCNEIREFQPATF